MPDDGHTPRHDGDPDQGWARQLRRAAIALVALVAVIVIAVALGLRVDGDGVQWPQMPFAAGIADDGPAAESEASSAKERTVAPGEDLAAAVRSLPDGGILHLAASAYRLDEALVLRRSITIIGAGAESTKVTGSGTAVLLVAGTPAITVRDVSLTNESDAASSIVKVRTAPGPQDNRVRFLGCTFSGAQLVSADDYDHGYGIDIRGDSVVSLRDCLFTGNALNVAASGTANVDVWSCTLTDSGTAVAVMEQAEVWVGNSEIRDNPGSGLWSAGGTARVTNSTVTGNRYGLSAFMDGRLEVEDCFVADNGRCGIDARGDARMRLRNTEVINNGRGGEGPNVGIRVTGRARAVVRRCVSSTRKPGLGRQVGGILVSGSARAEISDTICEGNLEYGISFRDRATGSVRGGRCAGSPRDLVIEPDARVESDAGSKG